MILSVTFTLSLSKGECDTGKEGGRNRKVGKKSAGIRKSDSCARTLIGPLFASSSLPLGSHPTAAFFLGRISSSWQPSFLTINGAVGEA